jgi:CRISPR-associated protein Cas2
MPFTVITLKKVPNALRGDLTRWMQEIATGVYVGNFNSKVRKYLWQRVTDAVGQGEATISYSCRNEIGYSFLTYQTDRQVINYDGLPLVLIPKDNTASMNKENQKHGFSNASRFHHARQRQQAAASRSQLKTELVFLDLETTGLNPDEDEIIEIGAVKVTYEGCSEFNRLIKIQKNIPNQVQKLTGITNEMLADGMLLKDALNELQQFIQHATLIGYNISFDLKFLNRDLISCSMDLIHNKAIDLLAEAKKRNSFQSDYKFATTLIEYGINKTVPHRALGDVKLMYELYSHMGLPLPGKRESE